MNEISIYTLTNPFTGSIYYVGQTVNLVQRRNAHPYCIYDDKKVRPIIEEIDRCDEKDKLKVENYWISQFHAWGYPLINTYIPGVCRYKKPNKKKVKKERIKRPVIPAGFREDILIEMSGNESILEVVSEYFGIKRSTAEILILSDHTKLTQLGLLFRLTRILGYSEYNDLFKKAA
jgi:hypothetical protein